MPTDAEPRWLSAGELDAWIGLIKLAARIVALSDGQLRRDHGITGRDYELLHHLSEADDGHRVAELADRIDDSSSCITHRVNRLASAGFVTKRVDPADQRARRVALTGAGHELLARAAPGHVANVRRWVIDPLDDSDLADLTRVAGRLNAHLRRVEPAGGAEVTPTA